MGITRTFYFPDDSKELLDDLEYIGRQLLNPKKSINRVALQAFKEYRNRYIVILSKTQQDQKETEPLQLCQFSETRQKIIEADREYRSASGK